MSLDCTEKKLEPKRLPWGIVLKNGTSLGDVVLSLQYLTLYSLQTFVISQGTEFEVFFCFFFIILSIIGHAGLMDNGD